MREREKKKLQKERAKVHTKEKNNISTREREIKTRRSILKPQHLPHPKRDETYSNYIVSHSVTRRTDSQVERGRKKEKKEKKERRKKQSEK